MEKNMKNNESRIFNYLLKISLSFTFLFLIFLVNNNQAILAVSNQDEFIYLSDIQYIEEQSSVGYGSILLDTNINTGFNNGLITLIIDEKQTPFLKGVLAHAPSTLVYDISEYNYDYFTSYIGVDVSTGTRGNGVKIAIYTSTNGEDWDLKTEVSPPVQKGDSEAIFVKIDIKDVKYLKLYSTDLKNKDSDHTVYANAKLIKNGYEEDNTPVDFIKPLEEYDEIIKEMNLEAQISEENELILLQRKFVSCFGYDILQAYAKYSDENLETLRWLMTDKENLSLYITGGKPNGSYVNSLKVLVSLYTNYKEDLDINTVTSKETGIGIRLGDLYRNMMITLSLTHSANISSWIGGNQISDPVRRYEIFKDLHSRGLLESKVFEGLTIEEMRWVLDNKIADDEIEWLNAYSKKHNSRNPYSYITYRFGYNYNKPQYYSEENYEKWDEKYELSKYNLTYQVGKPKLWIVFEEGSVCGGLSKTGSNLNGVVGIPSAVIGQPGHAAYLEYSQTEDGMGMWGIGNNISGWTASEKGERMLLGWGSNNWDSYYQVSYISLSQNAINDIENLEKAQKILLLADLYQDNPEMLEKIYRKAISVQSINLDAWYGLVRAYQANESKTEADYYALAEDITSNMKYYPLPMCDLLNLFKSKFVSPTYNVRYTLLEKSALEIASKVGTAEGEPTTLLQPSITRTMAIALLNKTDHSIASFSFDGPNAGEIVLADRYQDTTVVYEYSLDGKQTWKQTQDSNKKLTPEELDSINAEDDIIIHLVGTPADDVFVIDIREQEAPNIIYNNDLENKVIGATDSMEWRMEGSSVWTSFKDDEPDLTGNKTVIVRNTRTGIYLTSSEKVLSYTEDIIDEKRKYIPISHLSLHEFSSEAGEHDKWARYAIDGNLNTGWHSAWNGSDTNRFITIKLDKPFYLTAMEYTPGQGGNGGVLNAKILVSMDGEDWTEVIKETNWQNNSTTKIANFEEPVKAQYIKLIGTRTATTNGKSYMTSSMINLYEDSTQIVEPDVPVEPDIPDKPVEPDKPDVPNTPDTPTTPGKPTDKIVKGDVNGDGKITVTDLAKVKLHIIKKELLTGDSFKAADINEDGKVSVTDLAAIKLMLIGKKK